MDATVLLVGSQMVPGLEEGFLIQVLLAED